MTAKFLSLILAIASCSSQSAEPSPALNPPSRTNAQNLKVYQTVADIDLPEGFTRVYSQKKTFAEYLVSLPLKSSNTVYLYNGKIKANQDAQFAVLDVPVGSKDLQQCADAVMRLRAEYLFSQKNFNAIIFFDNDGKVYKFTAPYERNSFERYLERVFGMCGSASLSKQLKQTSTADIKAGDVFIRGGFPGHAVIVMDVIENTSGEKKFLLAQSYMPAQDIHILKNPLSGEGSPWYDLDDSPELITPEYNFYKSELKRW